MNNFIEISHGRMLNLARFGAFQLLDAAYDASALPVGSDHELIASYGFGIALKGWLVGLDDATTPRWVRYYDAISQREVLFNPGAIVSMRLECDGKRRGSWRISIGCEVCVEYVANPQDKNFDERSDFAEGLIPGVRSIGIKTEDFERIKKRLRPVELPFDPAAKATDAELKDADEFVFEAFEEEGA